MLVQTYRKPRAPAPPGEYRCEPPTTTSSLPLPSRSPTAGVECTGYQAISVFCDPLPQLLQVSCAPVLPLKITILLLLAISTSNEPFPSTSAITGDFRLPRSGSLPPPIASPGVAVHLGVGLS